MVLNEKVYLGVRLMCGGGGGGGQAPPPPPPPPEAAPVMFGAKKTELETNSKNANKVGKARLQIPLESIGGTTGLGIPAP